MGFWGRGIDPARSARPSVVHGAVCMLPVWLVCALLSLCLAGCGSVPVTDDASSGADDTPDVAQEATASSNAIYVGGGLPLGDDGVLTVALDPGHGAEDHGEDRFGPYESDINWAIAMHCVDYLEGCIDVEVVLTRDEDENPDFAERTARAVAAKADVLVSLHVNANDEDASLRGATLYYPNTISTCNIACATTGACVANAILDKLVAIGAKDNGVLERPMVISGPEDASYAYPGDETGVSDYYAILRVPRASNMPAVLVEHAFLSNVNDATLLASDLFLNALGRADAQGILEAFGFQIA